MSRVREGGARRTPQRAADYVKRVRERVVARRLREQAAAKEDDDEEEETDFEVEDPDADHEPLGKRGPEDPPDGEGGLWKGERPVRQLPAASRAWRSSWTAARHTM